MKKYSLLAACLLLCSCGVEPDTTTATPAAQNELNETINSVAFDENWYEADNLLGTPMLVSRSEETDCAVYVLSEDYDDLENSQYVIIEHDGTVDRIQAQWIERFRTAFDVHYRDFENDGEKEIVTVRYAAGGTYCSIEELAVYKKTDGHFTCSVFNHDDALDKIVRWSCDEGRNVLTISAEGFDAFGEFDLSRYTSNGKCEIEYGNVYYYDVTDEGIKMTAHLFIVIPEAAMPVDSVLLDMDIDFIDGEFICSNPVFSLANET